MKKTVLIGLAGISLLMSACSEPETQAAEVVETSPMVETEQGFAMNDICQKRFLSFCRAYLNRDKKYIDQLRMRGMAKINLNSYQMVM